MLRDVLNNNLQAYCHDGNNFDKFKQGLETVVILY